jgi:hypothetical protein
MRLVEEASYHDFRGGTKRDGIVAIYLSVVIAFVCFMRSSWSAVVGKRRTIVK